MINFLKTEKLETYSCLTGSLGSLMEEENLKSTSFLVLLPEIMTSPRSPMEGCTGASMKRNMLSGWNFSKQEKYLHTDKHSWCLPTLIGIFCSTEVL